MLWPKPIRVDPRLRFVEALLRDATGRPSFTHGATVVPNDEGGASVAREERTQCAKCGGAMEEGFEISGPMGHAMKPDEWVGGAPEPSIWTGTKLRGKERRPIVTYRCERCGFLESYAR